MAARKEKSTSFMSCMEAMHVKPGIVLASNFGIGDDAWLVTSVATRVKDRWMIIDMKHITTNKKHTGKIAPDDVVERLVHREWL